ncbi:MAG: multiheme c-type cytochrome, partial [Thermoanaerobaculia bacterium]
MCTSKATPVHVLLIGVGAFLCLAPGPVLSAAEDEVDPEGYTSARVCGECHSDIYESWKNSLHAFSLTDPIFDTAYMQAVKEAGEEARRVCLRCHAPMTMVNGDYELREGVT